MKPSDAAAEIQRLIEETKRRGGRGPSAELTQFLIELARSPGLKKSVRKSGGSSRAGPRPARDRQPADMSKTIIEIAQKLREAFESDDRFEALLTAPVTQKLSKTNVFQLYNSVFEAPRPLPRSLTKPDLFNAIRRERLNWVRGRS